MLDATTTIQQVTHEIQTGQLQPLDLVEHCLARIHQYESKLNAWVYVDDEGARREARRQAELMHQGSQLGPLAGIPIGIKDIIDVAGWPTKAGSPLREDSFAVRDAELVRQLRAAGAIILGKTVTTEFACFDPPPTRNPWNLNSTPGGSSSGSAAAVALGMCMAAVGTQTGGSIVRPASYCGVVGLKPTFGKVSLAGVVPVSYHLDHAGPITRCIHDARLVLEQLSVMQPGDSPPSHIQLRVIDDFFADEASPQVRSAFQAGLELLQADNHDLSTLGLPDSFADVHKCHKLIMAVEAAAYHRQQFLDFPGAFGPNISGLIETGLNATAVDYAAALEHQRRFQADIEHLLQDGSIVIMPATNTTAPGIETTGDPKFQSPWSYAGVPSVTIPGGLADDRLPWGLQLVSRRNSEHRLLMAAEQCEQRLRFCQMPSEYFSS